ncbi:hypothetical protein [Streptomyces sp. NBC_00338]|uniref:hypothetical protein n=1 Tax=Streptomyces sp. NBC_00338 TaxID=2975715 RepID=UPI002250C42B|nr:hypothetical protein [Streptomyces sp. NBC_00338]MCX5138368.1 hypothetical protein [Streptomyces sp. NBC_00338]MCX5145157.1 hypothetical protein [Streptomyces sp. NBC_00338]
MRRFLLGFVLGAAGSGITYGISHSLHWAAVVGVVVLLLVWLGEFILDDLL